MRIPLLFLLMLLAAGPAAAQSAAADALPLTSEAYFHRAAQAYIGGATDAAKATVRQGLEVYPDDGKLQALQKKLDEERQQQGGASGSQNQPQDQGQGSSDASGQQRDPDEQNAQGQPAEEESEEGERDPEAPPTPPDDPQPSDEEAKQPDAEDTQAGGQAAAPGENELSRAEAARILEALQNQEEQLLRQAQKRTARPRRVEKDW